MPEEVKNKIWEGNRWKKVSEEVKRKISIANKWKNTRTKGKKMWNKKDRKKISERQMWEKNPNWNGWKTKISVKIRTSIEWNLWRNSVFWRDYYTCQKCKQYGGNLNAHHIKNFSDFPELRFAIDNGICLCRKCHNKFHKKYWKTNNSKYQLDEFIFLKNL